MCCRTLKTRDLFLDFSFEPLRRIPVEPPRWEWAVLQVERLIDINQFEWVTCAGAAAVLKTLVIGHVSHVTDAPS